MPATAPGVAVPESNSQLTTPPASPLLSLAAVSMAALFLEIVLIRWISTEVRVFAFVQNLALIACFLGFGVGCFRSGRRVNLLASLVAITALVILVILPERHWWLLLQDISNLLAISPDAALWGFDPHYSMRVLPLLTVAAVVVMTALLSLLVVTMIPLGQWVGAYLEACRNSIAGYTANLAGSIAGLWLLPVLAVFWLPPACWFVAVFVLVMLVDRSRTTLIGGAAMLALLLVVSTKLALPGTFWSPYQKLSLYPLDHQQYRVEVNNSSYMQMADSRLAMAAVNSYDTPFRFAERREQVLIVGAGAGNDAAAALRNGAAHVDAVEIDPLIYSLGKRLHPERPYSSGMVHVTINDARNFLRETGRKYDVIVFGLLDSHTEFSGYSNMRVDNYVYTEEAFQQARRLLNPGGILVLKFEVRAPWTWMGQRFYALFTNVFGRAPVTFYCPEAGALSSATVFIESNNPGLWQRAAQPELAGIVAQHPPSFTLTTAGAPQPTTDDWPYVYHRGRTIPRTYLTVTVLLLGMAILMVGRVFENTSASWNLFFLGAGFLLIETHMVSRLALYFGTTWLVNCVALTAILAVLVLANIYVSRRQPEDLRPYYALLVASLLVDYLVPWHRMPWSAHTSGIVLSCSYAVPLFFAGIIFTRTFERSERKAAAFGANIVGAVAGGLAQNLSFILGMNALLLVAAGFYVCAALSRKSQFQARLFVRS
ncbi:MAG: hypothetical protein ACR2IF_01960 [Terriglobales bacterium]